MQLKINQEKVDAFKNTAVGKRAFADFTKEVKLVFYHLGSAARERSWWDV